MSQDEKQEKNQGKFEKFSEEFEALKLKYELQVEAVIQAQPHGIFPMLNVRPLRDEEAEQIKNEL